MGFSAKTMLKRKGTCDWTRILWVVDEASYWIDNTSYHIDNQHDEYCNRKHSKDCWCCIDKGDKALCAMCKVNAFKHKSEHNKYVNEVHHKNKGIVELCWVKTWILVYCCQYIAKEPVSKSKHSDVDGEHE